MRKTPKKAIHPLVYEHDTVCAIGAVFFGEADFFSAKRLFLREARDVSGAHSAPPWARVEIKLKTSFLALSHSLSHERASALTSPPHDFFVRFMLQRKTNVFKSKAVCASLNERAVRIKLIFIGQFQFFFIFAIGNGVWCLHRSVFH